MENKCIDIMNISQFPKYDVLWCDPPWGNRMVKFFETQLKKDSNILVANSIELIIKKLATLADRNKPLFIVYSNKKEAEMIIQICCEQGHRLSDVVPCIQRNNKSFVLLCFNTEIKYPYGLKGKMTMKYMVDELQPKIIFDPFAGIGKTAKTARDLGCHYIGYEINPKRFERMNKVFSK